MLIDKYQQFTNFNYDSADHSTIIDTTFSDYAFPSNFNGNTNPKRFKVFGDLSGFSAFTQLRTLGIQLAVELNSYGSNSFIEIGYHYIDIPTTQSGSSSPYSFSFTGSTNQAFYRAKISLNWWNGSFNDPSINYINIYAKFANFPTSGVISFGDLCDNLFIPREDGALDINDSRLRTIAGIPSGQISLGDFYGK